MCVVLGVLHILSFLTITEFQYAITLRSHVLVSCINGLATFFRSTCYKLLALVCKYYYSKSIRLVCIVHSAFAA